METVEQILERQCAELNFKNGKVKYFSISTQWDEANTIDGAVKNILEADKKYNGRAPIAHWIENQDIHCEGVSSEELERIVDIFNSIPKEYYISAKDFIALEEV